MNAQIIRLVATAVFATVFAMTANAQSGKQSGASDNAATAQGKQFTDDPRLNLTSDQERTIYQETNSAQKQSAPTNMPMIVGGMVPKSMKLQDIPQDVKQQVGGLKDYKFAKLQDEKVLLVDPTNRVVVGIISEGEGRY
jgi:hypothetical protein